MDFGRPSLRLFTTMLLVAIPPFVVYAAFTVLAGDWLLRRGIGAGTQLAIGVAITLTWAAVIAGTASRRTAGEQRSMIELVERGAAAGLADEHMGEVHRRLAAALDERNRQIADLAEVARRAPIATDAALVARSIAEAARAFTGDPIWVVIILRSSTPEALPAGVYAPDPADPVAPLEDLHRWASTLEPDGVTPPGARHAVGPWGAFMIVDVGATDQLAALLLAPWEGRIPPTPAELSLLTLLGQYAVTTIEHAILYTQLREQTDELNRMAALQTDFLRGVTHDLQTPLTSIGALASELRRTQPLDDAGQDDLATITHQADRLRRMVGQLLAVSRLEAGALTPRSEVFRLEPVLRRTWQALRSSGALKVEVDGEPLLVVADPDRVEQVLWAILDNAVKYSPAGSPVTVRMSSHRAGDNGTMNAILSVSDRGAGMDHVARDHAFDQFYRADIARQLAPDGSGIGLFAARGLILAMDGDIAIDSEVGAGTTVTIRLPAEHAERIVNVE